MRGPFDDEDFVQAVAQRDTEVTLGNGTLLLLAIGLLLVCAACFGLGYAVGHRSTQPSTATTDTPGAPPATQTQGSSVKPPAAAQPAATAPAQDTSAQPSSTQPPANPAEPAVFVPVPSQPAPPAATPPSTLPQVHPAFPPAAATPQASSASATHPVTPSATQFMVQIAAVSHQEDADVLIGALRRRGYAVSAHRDPVDNLIHVRIGPFNNHDEANRWRIKLLDDGYNALIQP